jgi:membrane protease YdiL (CAAX protease family)
LAEVHGSGGLVMLNLPGAFRRAVGFLGAGVYEELLFRLILLSLFAWFVARLGARSRASIAAAVTITSLTFAAAHYLGPYGEPLAWTEFTFWFSFVFRLLAGVFFSLLFVHRGFGIAAGTHAAYDILVGVVRF